MYLSDICNIVTLFTTVIYYSIMTPLHSKLVKFKKFSMQICQQ